MLQWDAAAQKVKDIGVDAAVHLLGVDPLGQRDAARRGQHHLLAGQLGDDRLGRAHAQLHEATGQLRGHHTGQRVVQVGEVDAVGQGLRRGCLEHVRDCPRGV